MNAQAEQEEWTHPNSQITQHVENEEVDEDIDVDPGEEEEVDEEDADHYYVDDKVTPSRSKRVFLQSAIQPGKQ